jgi:signal-transduction protein with cAMP-binding, CBS, and nucleotidyltransferase domain
MSKPAITVEADTSVVDVIRLMYNQRIGSVIVTEKNDTVGIFTRRDLIGRVFIEKDLPVKLKVGEVMSSPIMTVKSKDDVIKAVEIMKENQITRVIVLDDSKPVGILTETDIEIKLTKSSLSYRLAIKRYIVDTLAYIIFWSWITILIQIGIVDVPIEKFIATSILGFIMTLLLGGLFGRFLDLFRSKLGVM